MRVGLFELHMPIALPPPMISSSSAAPSENFAAKPASRKNKSATASAQMQPSSVGSSAANVASAGTRSSVSYEFSTPTSTSWPTLQLVKIPESHKHDGEGTFRHRFTCESSFSARYKVSAVESMLMQMSAFAITKVTGVAPGTVTSGGHHGPSANGQSLTTPARATDREPRSKRPSLRLVRE